MPYLIFAALSICVFLFSPGTSPRNGAAAISYTKDLQVLKESLEKNHPSLYRFKSKKAIDRLFDSCAGALTDQTTEREFYRVVKYILSGIEDGHLACSAPDSLEKQFDEKEMYFPVTLYFSEKRAFVDCSHLTELLPGTELLEINGVSVETVITSLFRYIVSDGKIEAKKYWILNRNFWFYYNLVYGERMAHTVKYRSADGQLATMQVNSGLRSNIVCKSLRDAGEEPLLQLEYIHSHTALLNIRTFSKDQLDDAGLDFARFLDSAFADIQKKQPASLIIDLRGNGGGRDVYGALLYSYLSSSTFKYYKKLETTARVLKQSEHPNLAVQQPQPQAFTGKVFILINGLSFSATAEFCTVVKNNKRATFIGEETGGTYCGNTSGSNTETVLPASGITVFIPTTRYTMYTPDRKNKYRGILPDYPIKPTINDLLNHNDVQLNLAVQLAGRIKIQDNAH